MKRPQKDKKVRTYCIADGYRVILETTSIDSFIQSLVAHAQVMLQSPKENTYTIYNKDITDLDREINQKNKDHMERMRLVE